MRCFCRWDVHSPKLSFRDQTILQFGDSWDLIANFVLLNPGSALPLNTTNQTDFLKSKSLPFFIEPIEDEVYLEFKTDPLMKTLIKLFAGEFTGGVIKIYNLFNLKNQDSEQALKQLIQYRQHGKMFTKDAEIRFCDAPVIIASGGNVNDSTMLKQELIRHIGIASNDRLYRLGKISDKQFSILKVIANHNNMIESYHPSFTFKYGNTTNLGDLLSLNNIQRSC